MDVDEEGVEPPVHNKESDGDLVAADDLNVFPRVPRHQADIQQTAAREGCVESWRISELDINDGWIVRITLTRHNEEKEDILVENTPQAPLGGKFVGEIERRKREGQTEERQDREGKNHFCLESGEFLPQ